MDPTQTAPFQHWLDPKPDELAGTLHEFLHSLKGPAHIQIRGQDRSRNRALVTLLHGNEPSGLTALYHLLKQGIQPAVDVHCFIPAVQTAQAVPEFSLRMLPGARDLNRCFKPPFDGPEGALAKALLDRLRALQPEALLDIHNTSGSGPSFAVTTYMDAKHDALTSLFTNRVIVTDLKLGALMEISEALLPTVTIECGGAQDEESSRLAEDGLRRYFTEDDVLSPAATDFGLEFFYNPIRLELSDGGQIAYGDQALTSKGITLKPDIEHHNFSEVTPQTPLGYLNADALQWLTAKNTRGENVLKRHFEVRDGVFFPRHQLKLFMITSNPVIAKSDCLFYLVPVETTH